MLHTFCQAKGSFFCLQANGASQASKPPASVPIHQFPILSLSQAICQVYSSDVIFFSRAFLFFTTSFYT
uniref:Uncharacterized protein n=1 Tax=Rhizophora mucronata TaxID=61149 RepID=A0A2P2K403_RHIMU